MDASGRTLSRRSFVRTAGAALALGALAALPPRVSLAGWHVSGAGFGVEGTGSDAGAPTEGEGAAGTPGEGEGAAGTPTEGEGAAGAPTEGEGAAGTPGAFPTIKFGTYPQGANGEVAPIEWYVLKERDGRQLLLSKCVLDAQPYNKKPIGVTWETCTLRAWLNADFLDAAFSADELARVAEVELSNPDNPDWGTPGGNNTHDHVFCLSIGEAMVHFGVRYTWQQFSDELGENWYRRFDGSWDYARVYTEEPGYKALVAYATDYAVSRGAYVWEDEAFAEYDGGSFWWLRSLGIDEDNAANVYPFGAVITNGYGVDYTIVGVRPALWLAL